ncbi:hypothetical protein RvY_12525 [Ramazzottius varieornatus]|uniref:Uncharacterized protein n=1 Tax=Ramazzottius varieornatus TaxID=947166 RepID=A0A1D1VM34_RAMVA|nr:hypothetical protein RvY_12525 [Ramazzottius varieornatus]
MPLSVNTAARSQQASGTSAITRSNAVAAGEGQPVSGSAFAASEKGLRVCGRALNGSRTGFVTLTLITISVILCLMPNDIYFTWQMITDRGVVEVYLVVDAIRSLTTVIDPVLIVLGNAAQGKVIFDKLRFWWL